MPSLAHIYKLKSKKNDVAIEMHWKLFFYNRNTLKTGSQDMIIMIYTYKPVRCFESLSLSRFILNQNIQIIKMFNSFLSVCREKSSFSVVFI